MAAVPPTHHSVDPDAGAFESDAPKALEHMRLALANVIAALPESGKSASALARSLGLNRKIVWQVSRLVGADGEHITPASATQLLPGAAALEGFLEACQARGVPGDLVDAVRDASRRIDDLAVLHGGDRASLFSLLRQASAREGDTGAERAAEAVRRQAWNANGEIWGIQTRAYFAAAVLAPGSEPGRIDDLSIAGEIGIRRLRAGAPRVIAGLGFHTGPGDPAGPPAPRALVPVEPASGMIEPMVPRFTSARVRLAPSESAPAGQTLVELVESPVGRSGEVNFVLAQFCPNVGRQFATDTVKRVHFSAHLFSPYSVVIQDLIIRRDLWPPISASARVYSALRGMMTQKQRDDRDILPIRAEVKHLGTGLRALGEHGGEHVPDYATIVDWACAQVGWNSAEFDVYRCAVMYPPMPSSLVVGVDLPTR